MLISCWWGLLGFKPIMPVDGTSQHRFQFSLRAKVFTLNTNFTRLHQVAEFINSENVHIVSYDDI